MVGNYVKEKSDTWWKEWAKLLEIDHLRKKERKKSCYIVFLKFYVDGAWNQKNLSIGALRWWICVFWWYILFQNSFL